ncbi:MAG: carboxypeptidase regulatory-like domain-containing protein, partial [Planctomycetota bacterium]
LLVAVDAGITLSGPPAKAPARNDVVITPLEPLHRANTPARNDTHRANAAVSHTPAANTDPLTPATDEPPPADAAQMLQIVGVVVDGLGRPVPAATIALYDSSSEGSTRSGSDGRFTLLADPADPADQSWLNVKVTCDGYLPRYTNARFAEGKTRSDIGTLRLDRPVHLSGVVRNRAGSPIENAVVRRGPAFSRVGYYLSGPADAPTGTSPASPDDDLGPEGTRTDAQGRFDLAALPPGRISVSADHPAYCPVELPFTFADGETRGPIEIVLDDPMTLDVFVTASDGALLPGVSVMAREADYNPQRMKDVPQWTATTDASGFARIEGLTVEVVELNVSAPPHASFRRKIRLAAGTNRQDVVLSTGGTLVGRVLIGDRPAANRGVMIGAMTAAGEFLQPTDTADVRFRMSTTDDAGRFCEPGLPPGTYGVRVDSAPVSTTDSRMTQAVTTGPLTIDDGEADCGDITVGVFASLIVRVVDADGKPLPGVQVRTMAINAMLTDADGRVELPPVGFLAYPMQVMVTRDDPTTGRSVIGAMGVPSWPLNESREVELRLDPPATLRVRTLDLVGTPVSQLVMLFGETGTRLVSNLWGATTPGDGSAIDVAVYPGTWRLRARGNQRADDSETIVTVGPGETRNVDLMPREPWTCEVEVRRFDGLPAAGRSCRLGSLDFGANGQFTLASYLMPTDVGATDRDGVLRLLVPALRMPDESCTLALEVGGADGEPATVFELSRSDNAAGRLVVTLLPPPSARAGATIRGLLRDADDRPVAGGEVVLLRTPAAGSRLRYRHVVRTGVDGRFAATDLPAGSWTLMPGDVTVDLLDGQTVERDLLAGASR